MNQKHIAEETQDWEITLPVLRRLSAELDAGTMALARNDLKNFEKHVAEQGKLCDLLVEANLISDPGCAQSMPRSSESPAAVKELQRGLDHKKRVYAAMIERVQRFVRIMLAVHQSRRGYTFEEGVPLDSSTWSSKV